jgi:hypothetical protein
MWTRAAVVAAACLAAGLVLAFVADDFYHGDDVAHYLMAHDGWHDADRMLHRWGRPGYTIPVMLVDRLFGLRGCRVFSALLTGLTGWLAFLIAWEITRGHPGARRFVWLAPALLWIQPLAATLAQTTLTETPAALYLTAAVYLWLRGRRVAALGFLSLLFVTRYETLVFAPVAGIAHLLAIGREKGGLGGALRAGALWAGAVALVWAPALYVAVAALAGVSEAASPLGIFATEYTSDYGQGTWHHFALRWLVAAGVGALALAAAGIAHLGRRALVPAVAAFGLFALHTVLFRYGLFASGGYGRFLVPAASAVAALAAAGVGAVAHGARGARVAALLVLALAPLAVLDHDVETPVVVIVLILACFYGLCALRTALPAKKAQVALVRTALWTALGFAALQAALLVRPLVVIRNPPTDLVIPIGPEASTARLRVTPGMFVRPLGLRAMLESSVLVRCMEAAPEGVPLLTNDTLLRCHRPETIAAKDPREALRHWREAPDGAVFVRFFVVGRDADQAELRAALEREGTLLVEHRAGAFAAAAYVRQSGG